MKSLIIIWAIAIIAVVGTTTYISQAIDAHVEQSQADARPPALTVRNNYGTDLNTYNPQATIDGASLQGGGL